MPLETVSMEDQPAGNVRRNPAYAKQCAMGMTLPAPGAKVTEERRTEHPDLKDEEMQALGQVIYDKAEALWIKNTPQTMVWGFIHDLVTKHKPVSQAPLIRGGEHAPPLPCLSLKPSPRELEARDDAAAAPAAPAEVTSATKEDVRVDPPSTAANAAEASTTALLELSSAAAEPAAPPTDAFLDRLSSEREQACQGLMPASGADQAGDGPVISGLRWTAAAEPRPTLRTIPIDRAS